MAGGGSQRSLEQTPTWAVAAVCFILVAISIILELLLHLLDKWLRKKRKRALREALEKIKAELMLLGFISLLLTVVQDYIAKICIPRSVGRSWHPCAPDDDLDNHEESYDGNCQDKDKSQFFSADALHELHIFIFVLALTHILYCITTLGLGTLKMRKWKAWEDETKTLDYQFYHDPERFRFARDTSFGRRHLHFWSKTPILLWMVCFFRQFITSVAKVDYLTLRHGFMMAHLGPNSHASFDFQKYIGRTLDEDFKVVAGINPIIWLFAVLFLLTNTHGWYSYFWLPIIPLFIILMVGAKLEVIITKMGLTIQDRGDVIKGSPLVKPGDDLFWFNRPRFLLFLIHFVLFQNAFQLAFFAFSWYKFGIPSCFHRRPEDIAIRVSMGILIQFLCSYVTLPLYALVTQMGSTMKPEIFNRTIASALKNWHNTAKRNIKESRHSETATPFSSSPATPSHLLGVSSSPVHLLRGYGNSNLDGDNSLQRSPSHRESKSNLEIQVLEPEIDSTERGKQDNTSTNENPRRSQHETNIFSFIERRT